MSRHAAPTSLDEVEKQLKDRMVATGEWHRLTKLLKAKLQNSGWEAKLQAEADQYAGTQASPSVRDIMDHVAPKAQQSIPADIREQMEAEIRKYIEGNVEG